VTNEKKVRKIGKISPTHPNCCAGHNTISFRLASSVDSKCPPISRLNKTLGRDHTGMEKKREKEKGEEG